MSIENLEILFKALHRARQPGSRSLLLVWDEANLQQTIEMVNPRGSEAWSSDVKFRGAVGSMLDVLVPDDPSTFSPPLSRPLYPDLFDIGDGPIFAIWKDYLHGIRSDTIRFNILKSQCLNELAPDLPDPELVISHSNPEEIESSKYHKKDGGLLSKVDETLNRLDQLEDKINKLSILDDANALDKHMDMCRDILMITAQSQEAVGAQYKLCMSLKDLLPISPDALRSSSDVENISLHLTSPAPPSSQSIVSLSGLKHSDPSITSPSSSSLPLVAPPSAEHAFVFPSLPFALIDPPSTPRPRRVQFVVTPPSQSGEEGSIVGDDFSIMGDASESGSQAFETSSHDSWSVSSVDSFETVSNPGSVPLDTSFNSGP